MAETCRIFVVGMGAGHFSVEVATSMDKFLQTSVLELKRKIYAIKSEVEPEYMRLLFAGGSKELDNEKTLEHYNIQKNSTINVVTRVVGGSSLERVPVPPESFEYKVHSSVRNSAELKLSATARDEILGEDADEDTPPRVQMSCGHFVDPLSLTQYCRSLISSQKFQLLCPAIVPKKANGSTKCDKVWQYPEVRKKALLTEAEQMYFESKLTEYAAESYFDLKECPRCRSTIERRDLTNLRVVCPFCRKQGKPDFCWQCLKDWSGPSTSGVKCGSPECVNPDLASIRDCPLKPIIRDAQDILVPIRRACPTCGKVLEHALSGCKNILCPRCNNEFCFACLKLTKECLKLKSGSYYKVCANPVAPKQTEIPVWSRKT